MRSKETKKLTKSATDKMIGGVMGGFGQYFGINSNYIRVGFVILSVLSSGFPGILVYILLMAIMPDDPKQPSLKDYLNKFTGQSEPEKPQSRKVVHDADETDEKD